MERYKRTDREERSRRIEVKAESDKKNQEECKKKRGFKKDKKIAVQEEF